MCLLPKIHTPCTINKVIEASSFAALVYTNCCCLQFFMLDCWTTPWKPQVSRHSVWTLPYLQGSKKPSQQFVCTSSVSVVCVPTTIYLCSEPLCFVPFVRNVSLWTNLQLSTSAFHGVFARGKHCLAVILILHSPHSTRHGARWCWATWP